MFSASLTAVGNGELGGSHKTKYILWHPFSLTNMEQASVQIQHQKMFIMFVLEIMNVATVHFNHRICVKRDRECLNIEA